MSEPLSDKKFRVYTTYENGRSGDSWGPWETLAEAEARLAEEGSWSCETSWIEDVNGLTPGDRALVDQAMKNHPEVSLAKTIEMLRTFGGL